MIAKIIGIILLIWFFVFLVKFLSDLKNSSNVNAFMDTWVKKTSWAWLPFYALQRLIKEVILGKK